MRVMPIYFKHIVYSDEPDERGNYIVGLDDTATPEMIKAYEEDKKQEELWRKQGKKV